MSEEVGKDRFNELGNLGHIECRQVPFITAKDVDIGRFGIKRIEYKTVEEIREMYPEQLNEGD